MNLGWSKIYYFGKNKILTTSFIWIAVVPIAASSLNEIDKIEVFGYTIHLLLPFNWHLFYFAALSIAIGKVIYVIACPEIISKYNTFYDYLNSGKGKVSLMQDFATSINNFDKQNFKSKIDYFIDNFCEVKSTVEVNPDMRLKYSSLHNDKCGDAFIYIRNINEAINRNWLFTCYIFYLIGSILLGFVVILNTISVLKSFIKNI